MDERDRAKRLLLARLGLYVCLPVTGLVVGGLIAGPLAALGGVVVGIILAVAAATALRG